jgi:hypothetical protein
MQVELMLIDIVFKYKAYRALLGRVSTFSHKSLNIPDSKKIYIYVWIIKCYYIAGRFGVVIINLFVVLSTYILYNKLIYYYYSIFKKPRQQQRFTLIPSRQQPYSF